MWNKIKNVLAWLFVIAVSLFLFLFLRRGEPFSKVRKEAETTLKESQKERLDEKIEIEEREEKRKEMIEKREQLRREIEEWREKVDDLL